MMAYSKTGRGISIEEFEPAPSDRGTFVREGREFLASCEPFPIETSRQEGANRTARAMRGRHSRTASKNV
jgi:hypothetical protein